MKLLRIVTLAAFVVLSTAQAKADSIPIGDPIIKTGGSSGGTGAPTRLGSAPAPAGIVDVVFSIFSATGTSPGTSPCVLIEGGIRIKSPTCFFENDITSNGVGVAITQLIFDAPGISPDTVTCQLINMLDFKQCGVDPFGDGGTMVTFSDGSIPFHGDFTLDFEGFPSNFTFGGTATPSPEPGTLAMFLAGIGALLVGRRLRARAR